MGDLYGLAYGLAGQWDMWMRKFRALGVEPPRAEIRELARTTTLTMLEAAEKVWLESCRKARGEQ